MEITSMDYCCTQAVGVKLKLKLFFTSRLIWIRAESDEARVFILPGGLVLHPTLTVTSY